MTCTRVNCACSGVNMGHGSAVETLQQDIRDDAMRKFIAEAHKAAMAEQGHIWLTAWYEIWVVFDIINPQTPGQFHREDRIRYEDEWRQALGIPSIYG